MQKRRLEEQPGSFFYSRLFAFIRGPNGLSHEQRRKYWAIE